MWTWSCAQTQRAALIPAGLTLYGSVPALNHSKRDEELQPLLLLACSETACWQRAASTVAMSRVLLGTQSTTHRIQHVAKVQKQTQPRCGVVECPPRGARSRVCPGPQHPASLKHGILTHCFTQVSLKRCRLRSKPALFLKPRPTLRPKHQPHLQPQGSPDHAGTARRRRTSRRATMCSHSARRGLRRRARTSHWWRGASRSASS